MLFCDFIQIFVWLVDFFCFTCYNKIEYFCDREEHIHEKGNQNSCNCRCAECRNALCSSSGNDSVQRQFCRHCQCGRRRRHHRDLQQRLRGRRCFGIHRQRRRRNHYRNRFAGIQRLLLHVRQRQSEKLERPAVPAGRQVRSRRAVHCQCRSKDRVVQLDQSEHGIHRCQRRTPLQQFAGTDQQRRLGNILQREVQLLRGRFQGIPVL